MPAASPAPSTATALTLHRLPAPGAAPLSAESGGICSPSAPWRRRVGNTIADSPPPTSAVPFPPLCAVHAGRRSRRWDRGGAVAALVCPSLADVASPRGRRCRQGRGLRRRCGRPVRSRRSAFAPGSSKRGRR